MFIINRTGCTNCGVFRTMEYYSAKQRNVTTRMNLTDIILNKRSLTRRVYNVWFHLYGVLKQDKPRGTVVAWQARDWFGRHTRELSGEIKIFYTMLSVWVTWKFFKCTLSSVQTSSTNITESLHPGKNNHWQKNGWTHVNLRDNIRNSYWKAKPAENVLIIVLMIHIGVIKI